MKKYLEPSIRISKFGVESIAVTADPPTASMFEPTTYDMWKDFYTKADDAAVILQYDNRTYIW